MHSNEWRFVRVRSYWLELDVQPLYSLSRGTLVQWAQRYVCYVWFNWREFKHMNGMTWGWWGLVQAVVWVLPFETRQTSRHKLLTTSHSHR